MIDIVLLKTVGYYPQKKYIILAGGEKPLKILALDQARNGAWAVFDYEKKELLDYGVFSFDAKKYTYAQAILQIESLVAQLLNRHQISAVFIEDIQLRANVQAFKRLAQLQGVLVNLFEKNEYLYGLIAPTQWQHFCADCGKAAQTDMTAEKKQSKLRSLQFARAQFHIQTENDNLTDAICIGWYVVNMVPII